MAKIVIPFAECFDSGVMAGVEKRFNIFFCFGFPKSPTTLRAGLRRRMFADPRSEI